MINADILFQVRCLVQPQSTFLKSSFAHAFRHPENRREGGEKNALAQLCLGLPCATLISSLVLRITNFCSLLSHMQRPKYWRKKAILFSAIRSDISNTSTLAFPHPTSFEADHVSFPTYLDLIGGERHFGKTSYSEAHGTYERSMAIIPSIMSELKERFNPMIFEDFTRTSFLFLIQLWDFL